MNGGGSENLSARDQLAATYDRYADALYRHALLITADHALAEDALQQAFAKLAAMGEGIGALDSVEGYLRIAVRNESYRLLQSRRLAIAVERYRLAIGGKLPQSLETLPGVAKELLTDPHTGKTFHFDKQADEYSISSEGPENARGKELSTKIDQWGIRVSLMGR